MLVLTKKAYFVCEHSGRADPEAWQDYVRVEDVPILVFGDPVGRSISNCPNYNPPAGIKSCKTTLPVETGYSTLVRISERQVCLSSVEGLTDGIAPGLRFHYSVKRSGQGWVTSV